MATLLISDFRGKQLKYCQDSRNYTPYNYSYLVEDTADYSWLNACAVNQLPLMPLDEILNVIIMLGFNDCVYSCAWRSFDLNTIADNYTKTVKELMEDYPSINFYLSSVGPVDSDYPFVGYKDEIIPESLLNETIKRFNDKLRADVSIPFIDCHAYLASTSFATRDGVRYLPDTCENLLSYINNSINIAANSEFKPRLQAPVVNSDDIESDRYWIKDSFNGGLNPYGVPGKYQKSPGDTLPNCTSYAWGRFYEILGSRPRLWGGNAETWYGASYTLVKDLEVMAKNGTAYDGYKRGNVPEVGAVICWEGIGGEAGHVAIVEVVNNDGSIVTSESGWENAKYWWITTRTNDNGNWGASTTKYKFQGFIYNPAITPTAHLANLDKSKVTSKDAALSNAEMENNAKYIWNYLGSRGWSLNAVAGMLGNMQYESTINPGRQQINGSGFGLVQWTPKTNLTSWTSANGYADDDIDGQLERIIWEKDNNKQYYKNNYKYTFKDFIESQDSPYTLACAFAFDYERSAIVLYGSNAEKEKLRQERGGAAEKWYKFLTPLAADDKIKERFVLDNLKLDKRAPTKVTASFITKNGSEYFYTLVDSSNVELIKNKKLTHVSISTNNLQTISFDCDKELTPNTEYTLSVIATSDLDGGNKLVKSITFTLPQDPPASVKTIEFSCADALKSTNSVFNLKVKMPDYLGYWGAISGYNKQLFVNGKCVKSKTVSNIKNLSESFTIKDEFGYDCSTGDIVQIGIRIWAKDDNGKLVYDAPAAKTSKPICLLNNTIQVYLGV